VRSLLNQRPWSGIDRNWGAASAALLAARILAKGAVLVACDPSDNDQIYGWCAVDPGKRILYYMYVKNTYRRAGVGLALMRAAFGEVGPQVRCCHWTDAAQHLKDKWGLVRDSHPLVELAKDAR
jgi:GNAT superfamily N-acetyltransferase